MQVLNIYKHMIASDRSLDEELSRAGSHVPLSRLIKFDGTCMEHETDQDTVMELQDLACEIAALSTSFPTRAAPITIEELRTRLPLTFHILPVTTHDITGEPGILEDQDDFTILINQVLIFVDFKHLGR